MISTQPKQSMHAAARSVASRGLEVKLAPTPSRNASREHMEACKQPNYPLLLSLLQDAVNAGFKSNVAMLMVENQHSAHAFCVRHMLFRAANIASYIPNSSSSAADMVSTSFNRCMLSASGADAAS